MTRLGSKASRPGGPARHWCSKRLGNPNIECVEWPGPDHRAGSRRAYATTDVDVGSRRSKPLDHFRARRSPSVRVWERRQALELLRVDSSVGHEGWDEIDLST